MNTLLAVFNAFPAILQSVQAVEEAIPMSNTGQQKMNLVLGAAATAWEVAQVGEQINKTNWLAGVQAMTNVAVAGLTAAGVLGTSSAANPTSAAATNTTTSTTTATAAATATPAAAAPSTASSAPVSSN